jgi:hypothetical protein
MLRKRHSLGRVALAFAVAAMAASGAQASIPADGGSPYQGTVGVPVRPDDRADHGVGTAAESPVRTPTQAAGPTGFDWGDAGIGAGASFGLVLVGSAAGLAVLRRRRSGFVRTA